MHLLFFRFWFLTASRADDPLSFKTKLMLDSITFTQNQNYFSDAMQSFRDNTSVLHFIKLVCHFRYNFVGNTWNQIASNPNPIEWRQTRNVDFYENCNFSCHTAQADWMPRLILMSFVSFPSVAKMPMHLKFLRFSCDPSCQMISKARCARIWSSETHDKFDNLCLSFKINQWTI